MEVAGPGPRPRDLDRALVRIGLGGEAEGKSLVLVRESPKGQCLSVAGANAPDQRDVHLASGTAAEINSPRVLFVVDQTETRLADSMRRRGIERDARALSAHKRLVRVHHDNVVSTNRPPFAGRHPERPASCLSRFCGVLGGDREIKFPVVQQLRPETAIHKSAAMLDESAVEILRNRRRRLSSVDGYL